MASWQTRRSTPVYENPWIRVREDAVLRPDGTPGVYGVVSLQHPAVFVVPVTDEDEVVLVEVDRYAIGRVSLEVPAGGSDGQEPLVAARRELAEETGLAADDWQDLAETFSLNGVCDAPGRVFLARGLHPAGGPGTDPVRAAGQAEEGIVGVRRVPWRDVPDLLRTGGVTDGETVAALMHAAVALGRLR